MKFQIYDINDSHELKDYREEESEEKNYLEKNDGIYKIHLFGRCDDGKSIYVKIEDMTPFFMIEVGDDFDKSDGKELLNNIKNGNIFSKNKKRENDFEFKKLKNRWDFYKKHLLKGKLLSFKKASGYYGEKEFKYYRFIFDNYSALKVLSSIFLDYNIKIGYNGKFKKYEVCESNLLPLLKWLHLRNITGCGWVEFDDSKEKEIEMENKESICDIEYHLEYNKLDGIKEDKFAKFRIASYDIEVYSSDPNKFPNAENKDDKIIQIGTTFNYHGEKNCYKKVLISLKDCDEIENTEVINVKSEKELLLRWKELLIEEQADIITGYNIFGFDEKYIHQRSIHYKVNVEKELLRMSKLRYLGGKFVEKELSSSALGDNKLYYYESPGFVRIDLMKVIQAGFKFNSFKLDNIASEFFKGNINQIELIEDDLILECDNIENININDYLHLEMEEKIIQDRFGEKFKIIDKKDKIIKLKLPIKLKDEYKDMKEKLEKKQIKLIWTMAKDDVSAKEMFKYYDKDSYHRSIIGKYCIKDCHLVSLIMEKLEIITNNISMANVCIVPLSYLFLRGQGIKAFSLVSYYYSKNNYAFPVIRKHDIEKEFGLKPEDDEETQHKKMSYIGAIVFPPDPGLYSQPIAVLDYNSLYPSVIIELNASHETMVINPLILTNEEIIEAEYQDLEGNKHYYQFVKTKEKGIIPQILNNLLVERKKTKKEMELEKDPFKKRIKDGHQLALKITANSIYGQLGATTSPICRKQIAACCTWTGRKRLIQAKRFAEEKFPIIYQTLKELYEKNKIEEIKVYLNEKLKNYQEKDFDNIKELIEKCKEYDISPLIRYGDTDSIFVDYRFLKNNKRIKSKHLEEKINKIKEELLKLTVKETTEEFRKDYDEYIFDGWLRSMIDVKKNDRKTKIEVFLDWAEIVFQNEYQLELVEDRKYNLEKMFNLIDEDLLNLVIIKTEKKNKYYLLGEQMIGNKELDIVIKMGLFNERCIGKELNNPHNLGYEKIFCPYLTLAKKKYVGHKYEMDPKKFKLNSNGIVLKRRDNAKIVKYICGGIINFLIEENNVEKCKDFLNKELRRLVRGEFNDSYFLMSKTLKGNYKDRSKIAHAVLTDRIKERAPGTEAQSNERVQYIHIFKGDSKDLLQGELIETPEYIKNNKCKIDYLHYLTNQIMNPAIQILELVMKNPNQIFDDIINEVNIDRSGEQDMMNFIKFK